MSDHLQQPSWNSPIAGAPTWVRILQAAIIGVVAGLALHVLFSMVTLSGETLGQGRPAPSQCRKTGAPREGATPRAIPPGISGVRYIPRALDGGTIPFMRM